MYDSTLITLGKIAGIGGLSVALVIIIFKSVLQKKVFARLTKDQTYKTINNIIKYTFCFGVLGLIVWFKPSLIKEPDVQFKEFDTVELKQKINTFDLNPNTPNVKLRFVSNKWNINFSFIASTEMRIRDLKNAIIDHFDLTNHIQINFINKFNRKPSIEGEIVPLWIMRINYKDYTDVPHDHNKKLAEIGIKNNDLITLKITWGIEKLLAYNADAKKKTLKKPDDIDL